MSIQTRVIARCDEEDCPRALAIPAFEVRQPYLFLIKHGWRHRNEELGIFTYCEEHKEINCG